MFHQKQEGWDDNEQGRALLFFRSTPEMLPLSLAERISNTLLQEKKPKAKKSFMEDQWVGQAVVLTLGESLGAVICNCITLDNITQDTGIYVGEMLP